MDPVALAATIGGTAVGLAGVAATVRSSRLQQQSAMEIASLQHEHERELARGGRLFERRAPVYEEMLKLLYVWMERIAATEPLIRYSTDPEPPDPPAQDEWRNMQVRLRTFGSVEVADTYGEVTRVITGFFNVAAVVQVEKGGGPVNQNSDSLFQLHETRAVVQETLRKLERLVSDELAAL
jgi:hypothetical protein